MDTSSITHRCPKIVLLVCSSSHFPESHQCWLMCSRLILHWAWKNAGAGGSAEPPMCTTMVCSMGAQRPSVQQWLHHRLHHSHHVWGSRRSPDCLWLHHLGRRSLSRWRATWRRMLAVLRHRRRRWYRHPRKHATLTWWGLPLHWLHHHLQHSRHSSPHRLGRYSLAGCRDTRPHLRQRKLHRHLQKTATLIWKGPTLMQQSTEWN